MIKNFILKEFLIAFCITFITFHLCAQKKDFTGEQLLKNKMPQVIVPLPVIDLWSDESHLILSRKVHPDSLARQFEFDVKTRKETAAEKDVDSKMVNTTKSVTIKNTDLYYKNGEAAEIKLTNDSAF